MSKAEGITNGENGMEVDPMTLTDDELPEEPLFLRDTPPNTGKKMDMIRWGLMHGKTEEDLVEAGFNRKTVQIAAFELEKEGYRKRPKKSSASRAKSKEESNVSSTAISEYGRRSVTAPTKPIPPEFLIEAIRLPMDGGHAKSFEQGMKFGASMLVLGVRVAQELSNMGMQQAKPIMDMANAMRAGEALAAKNAASEAAMMAAENVKEDIIPYFMNMYKEGVAKANPMRDMMSRMMEPILQKLMSMAIPGVITPPGAGTPPGWVKREESVE